MKMFRIFDSKKKDKKDPVKEYRTGYVLMNQQGTIISRIFETEKEARWWKDNGISVLEIKINKSE